MASADNIQQSAGLGMPTDYIYCFQAECPMAEQCIHFYAGQHIGNVRIGSTVFPAARANGTCGYYKLKRTIHGAWGFRALFDEAKAKDASSLRRQIKDYLGGNGTYYRYHKGERLLTPGQQEWIISLFKRYGYSANLVFDGYRDAIDW